MHGGRGLINDLDQWSRELSRIALTSIMLEKNEAKMSRLAVIG
jgi:hypothetical protein